MHKLWAERPSKGQRPFNNLLWPPGGPKEAVPLGSQGTGPLARPRATSVTPGSSGMRTTSLGKISRNIGKVPHHAHTMQQHPLNPRETLASVRNSCASKGIATASRMTM